MHYESRNFRIDADDEIFTIWLDLPGCLTHNALSELSLLLDRLAALPAPAAYLIRSRNRASFLENFDVRQLVELNGSLEGAALSRRAQEVARKLELLPSPTVAWIEGRCAGLGLELLLACSLRIAVDQGETRFDFSEFTHGLIPMAGGTLRLPRLIGLRHALLCWFESRSLSCRQARALGLVDALVPPGAADAERFRWLDKIRARPDGVARRLAPLWYSTTNRLLGRWLLAAHAGSARLPWQRELLAAVRQGLLSHADGLMAERAAVARLLEGEPTRRLIQLQHERSRPIRLVPEPRNPIPRAPERVGIVGGGSQAIPLARTLAEQGLEVLLRTSSPTDSAIAGQDSGRIRVTREWTGFDGLDLVIEAAAEDPGEKRNILQELEERVRPRAILATASTTVSVENLQGEALRPRRITGLHFPNLGDRLPLAELVRTEHTSTDVLAALAHWTRDWHFTPVLVADRPGRLVQWIRHVYLSEGVNLVAEGLPIEKIDRACREFGMVRGPLEWADELGFEPLAELTAHLQMARDDRFARNLLFQRLLPAGCLGRDSGEGFYRHGLRRRPNETVRMLLWQDLDEDARMSYIFDPRQAIRDGLERLFLRTANEAARLLPEEPESNPATVDMALALGMGWSPVLGGPLRYLDAVGLERAVDRLQQLAEKLGPRFFPCDELIRRAESGESFFPGEEPVGGKVLYWRVAA